MPPTKKDLNDRTDWILDHAGNAVFIHWSLRRTLRVLAMYPDMPPPIKVHTATLVQWLTRAGVPYHATFWITSVLARITEYAFPVLVLAMFTRSLIFTPAQPTAFMFIAIPAIVAGLILRVSVKSARNSNTTDPGELARKTAKRTVQRGYCPICLHSLDGLLLTTDKGVACPCCKSVWPTEWGDTINGYFRATAPRNAASTHSLFTVDDRGTKHRLKFPMIPPIIRSPSETEGTTLILDYLATREGPIARPLSLLLGFTGFALLATAVVGGASGFRAQAIGTLVIFGVLLVLSSIANWQMKLKLHRDTFENLFSQNRLCKACGYDCSGLIPDTNDGATQCPECSAAWIFPKG